MNDVKATRTKTKETLGPKKLEYAKKLAETHIKTERTISGVRIITSKFENNADEPIKLLEINTATSASGFFPVTFGPTGDIPYRSTLVELTPEEAKALEKNKLSKWPHGWEVGRWLYRRGKKKAGGR